jgi:hypothetical protein
MAQLIFAGAATVATLALFGAARPADTETVAASGPVQLADQGRAGGHIIAVNDDSPNNPSSGDIFQQNALDQSTASGAGT